MNKAIFWDCDGTIIHNNESFRDSLYHAIRANDFLTTQDEVKEYLKKVCSWFEPNKYFVHRRGEIWWDDLFDKLKVFLIEKNIPTYLHDKILFDFRDNVINFEYIPYSGVDELLAYCKCRGYKNYIISSNFPELDSVITRLGWENYFDGLFISSNIGYEKPSKKLYMYAYQKAGKPERCYMVGDNPIADMQGAKSVGMITILVHRKKELALNTDYSLNALMEIKDILS